MEASLEAAPQCIFQTVYLLAFGVENISVNNLVVVGLFFSVCKLGGTVIGADRVVCIPCKYCVHFLQFAGVHAFNKSANRRNCGLPSFFFFCLKIG